MVTLHIRTYRESSRGQVLLTLLKLALIVLFIATAWLVGSQYPQQLPLASLLDVGEVATGAGAVALIYVTYAYSGWNAATYILGELEEPQRDLPRALVVGCTVVTLVYVMLNTVFLTSAPLGDLSGEVEIAYIVAGEVLGSGGAFVVSLLLSGILISTVSAMVMAGPRALQRLGEDYRGLRWLGAINSHGLPRNRDGFIY